MSRILLLLFFVATQVFGQKAPIKFGKVELSELEMTVYPNDTSAPAVILCDYGFFDAERFNFTQITRIKILKKEGSHFANRMYNTESKAFVRGATYNLVNGEIIKTKLENSGIFVERETYNDNRIRVTMPDVKVGSVLEIEASFHGFPFKWHFQDRIPVMWSELVLENSP
jgi:hypothetical protein